MRLHNLKEPKSSKMAFFHVNAKIKIKQKKFSCVTKCNDLCICREIRNDT